MSKKFAGVSLKENQHTAGLGFKVAYLTAVVRNNSTAGATKVSEQNQRSAVSHWNLTESERSKLAQHPPNNKRAALYVNSWAGLEVLKCRLEGGNCTGAHSQRRCLQCHLALSQQ
jgi:hypothetical protein